MHDPLIDAVLAAPSDDAPRLVWADGEGGERGELVIIQCALARDGANERLRRRAAELLAANAHAWSGLPPMGHERADPMFVRGFMEGLRIDRISYVESLHPLRVFPGLKSIVLSETRIDPARARAAFSLLPQLESIRINRIELTR